MKFYQPSELQKINFGLELDNVSLVPQFSRIGSRQDVNTSTTLNGSNEKQIVLTIPVLSANMKSITEEEMAYKLSLLGGLPIIHRFFDGTIEESINKNIELYKRIKTQCLTVGTCIDRIGASCGVGEEEIIRAKKLIDEGIKIICVDVAHAHSEKTIKTIKEIKKSSNNIFIIAGNVATPIAVEELILAGADCVKVGIAGGSVCITRAITGHSIPVLSAIIDCAQMAKEYKRSIIADGGIKTSGDIVKALGAGADAVMLGYMLAGTDEAAGTVINGKKEYIGSSIKEGRTAEGKNILVEKTGPLSNIIQDIKGGIQSGCSYSNAHNVKELQGNALFIITNTNNY